MIILPSRNGMLLRNSNGILASDCGGPVEFNCPCTLLTGDNSDCYDTDCTPSTYIVTTTEESYCLVYVSGSTWQKTVGTRVITLNLEAASETASITIVDDSVTVFSGTNTGTSCIHRWTGSMSNTITPDTIGDVSYSTSCSQPELDCDCYLLEGDNCSCFGTDKTPSTYFVDFGDSGLYCLTRLNYCTWRKVVGSLTITLNHQWGYNTTRLQVVDGSTYVFVGDIYDANCSNRIEGTVANEISSSDWASASYFPPCHGYTCATDRLFKVEILDFVYSQFIRTYGSLNKLIFNVEHAVYYGFLSQSSGGLCKLSKYITLDNPTRQLDYYYYGDGGASCTPHEVELTTMPVSISYLPTLNPYFAGRINGKPTERLYVNIDDIGFGESFILNVIDQGCISYPQVHWCYTSSDFYLDEYQNCKATDTYPGKIKVTVY